MCNNLMKKFLILCVVLLTACQTGQSDNEATSTGSSGGGTGGGTGGTGGTTTVLFTIQTSLASLSAGGTSQIIATLTDDQQQPLAPTDVTFISSCVAQSLAAIDTPVTVIGTQAFASYTAQGCLGNDTITASVTVDNTTYTASTTVNVLSATLGSIEFVSANPANIELKGMGGAETSTITFRVLDTAGNPITNQSVTFTLNTEVGGLRFSPGAETDTSGLDGVVSTIVQSGTVSIPVRVTATVDSTGISSQSDNLVVSTGLPDQDSFSLALDIQNPEAFGYIGEQVVVSVLLGDRFNNPVPDGTQVVFTAESGVIGNACLTANGRCSVTWVSGNGTSDNRVSILAHVIGEESFTDLDGDISFDVGVETFVDLPEAFRDDNETGLYEPGDGNDPVFIDFNLDGAYSLGDGNYNGIVCDLAGCAPTLGVSSSVTVRRQHVIVLSPSGTRPIVFSNSAGATITSLSGGGSVTFEVIGGNGQVMPAGTTIAVAVSNGKIEGVSSFTVLSTNVNCDAMQTTHIPAPFPAACTYTVNWQGDTNSSSGTLNVTVTSPKGIVSSGQITVTD